jgi:hypothetical protein
MKPSNEEDVRCTFAEGLPKQQNDLDGKMGTEK